MDANTEPGAERGEKGTGETEHKGFYITFNYGDVWECDDDCPACSESDDDPMQGRCAVCGHDPACGYASVFHDGKEDWYCHGDCFHEDDGAPSCYEAGQYQAMQRTAAAFGNAAPLVGGSDA